MLSSNDCLNEFKVSTVQWRVAPSCFECSFRLKVLFVQRCKPSWRITSLKHTRSSKRNCLNKVFANSKFNYRRDVKRKQNSFIYICLHLTFGMAYINLLLKRNRHRHTFIVKEKIIACLRFFYRTDLLLSLIERWQRGYVIKEKLVVRQP